MLIPVPLFAERFNCRSNPDKHGQADATGNYGRWNYSTILLGLGHLGIMAARAALVPEIRPQFAPAIMPDPEA